MEMGEDHDCGMEILEKRQTLQHQRISNWNPSLKFGSIVKLINWRNLIVAVENHKAFRQD